MRFAPGKLVLDDCVEFFLASVDPATEWTRRDYERQWRDGLKQLVGGAAKSCLITSLPEPDCLFYWPMYRVGNWIVLQHAICFPHDLPQGFDPAKPYRVVRDWESISDCGARISEWWIAYNDLVNFIDQLNS